MNSPFNKQFSATVEDSLAFRVYEGDDFKDSKFEEQQGFCWGHAVVTQKFNRLADFSPNEKLLDKSGLPVESGSKEWVKLIKAKINSIIKNQAEMIPGFKNLHELSSTPPFDIHIKNQVAKQWAKEAMTFEGLGISLNSKVDSNKRIEKILNKLKLRIDQGISQQLIFTYNLYKFITHAVLVYKYIEDGNNLTLCIRDSMRIPLPKESCQNKMTFEINSKTNKYQIIYNNWGLIGGPVGGIRLGPNDDEQAIDQIKNLSTYCRQKLRCKI